MYIYLIKSVELDGGLGSKRHDWHGSTKSFTYFNIAVNVIGI